jgi:hypothetical protein
MKNSHDKLAWIQDVVDIVVASTRRRSTHVSPYKKTLNKDSALAMKVLKTPTDEVIRKWASVALTGTLGSKALGLSDKNINDIRGVALILVEIAEYPPHRIAVVLKDAATYSVNNADAQLQELMSSLQSTEDKKKISTHQMTHDRIGNALIIDMNSNSENFQKPIDTRRGFN